MAQITEHLLKIIDPVTLQITCIILGLIVGSFLNVVIYRVPKMIFNHRGSETISLWQPGSHCLHCKSHIRFYENIPLISFLILKGKCSKCDKRISFQYPLVEALSAILSWFAAWYFGLSVELAFVLLFFWALIALTIIDINHQLLPDIITLPLLWTGLLVNAYSIFSTPTDAILGAITGYLLLWSIYWIFKLITKKEGMGYGDFKLLAALGAWCGWQALPTIVLLSSLLGSIVGILLILCFRKKREIPMAFGPWLALSGIIAFIWRHDLELWWFHLTNIHHII